MSEPVVQTLKDQAMGMLQSMIATATQAGDFLKEQVPIVLRELLTYYSVWNGVKLAGLVLLIGGSVFGYVKFFKWANRTEDSLFDKVSHHPGFIIGSLFWCAGTIGATCGAASVASDLLKITLAPRVWLIEYAAGLVK